jgi:hypothetical protein
MGRRSRPPIRTELGTRGAGLTWRGAIRHRLGQAAAELVTLLYQILLNKHSTIGPFLHAGVALQVQAYKRKCQGCHQSTGSCQLQVRRQLITITFAAKAIDNCCNYSGTPPELPESKGHCGYTEEHTLPHCGNEPEARYPNRVCCGKPIACLQADSACQT